MSTFNVKAYRRAFAASGVERIAEDKFHVVSESEPGRVYVAHVGPYTPAYCSCPDFAYRGPHACKHLEAALAVSR